MMNRVRRPLIRAAADSSVSLAEGALSRDHEVHILSRHNTTIAGRRGLLHGRCFQSRPASHGFLLPYYQHGLHMVRT